MPKRIRELGGEEKDIPKLVSTLGATQERPVGNFVKLTDKDAEAIYRSAL